MTGTAPTAEVGGRNEPGEVGLTGRFAPTVRLAVRLPATACLALALPGAAPAQQHESASLRPAAGTERDWEIAADHLRWAHQQRLDTLPRFGGVLAAIGERFVGAPYAPGTLERPGPEQLVVNLETLDCVTFVETVLVLARLARAGDPGLADDPGRLRSAFAAELTRIRYRDGVLDGYASRLHYFSEWIADNDRRGVVRDLSRALGGVADAGPVDFMSTHPEAYAPLADPSVLSAVEVIEARLSAEARRYLPAERIAALASSIQDGDVIAATSTVDGLDVAHTGLALWRDGQLKLLHAPLVGSHVQITEGTLAERIERLGGQDGIMVARPVDPRPPGPDR